MGFFRTLFDPNEREVRKIRKIVDKINALEKGMEGRSDEELRQLTDDFRQRLQKKKSLDDILPEAFAAVRGSGFLVKTDRPGRRKQVRVLVSVHGTGQKLRNGFSGNRGHFWSWSREIPVRSIRAAAA